MEQESGKKQSNSKLQRRKKIFAKLLLAHRFGIDTSFTLDGQLYSVSDLDFETVLSALKHSFADFIEDKEQARKIIDFLMITLKFVDPNLTKRHVQKLIEDISQTISDYQKPIDLKNTSPEIIHSKLLFTFVKTIYQNHSSSKKEYIEGLAIFGNRMLKLNRGGPNKTSSIRFYRIEVVDSEKLFTIFEKLQNSLEYPVERTNWDKELNKLIKADKISEIKRKGKGVGNWAWATARLFAFAAVYGNVFLFCKSKKLKELDLHKIASFISEYIYKQFTIDDRNKAIHSCLIPSSSYQYPETISIMSRVDALRQHLRNTRHPVISDQNSLLWEIYLKSLNWLLSDYLKKGDIGATHRLLEEESHNPFWNPLAYAAKRNKTAVIDILSKVPHYVNYVDEHLNTALHIAVIYGRLEMCQILLKNQYKNHLDIDARNDAGWTVLHMAAMYNRTAIIEFLLKKQPKLLEMTTKNGETALKLACDSHQLDTVKLLLSKNASLQGIDFSQYPDSISKQIKLASRTKPKSH